MNRLRLLSLAILLSMVSACGYEDFATTSQALMSAYHIGNGATVAGTTATAITAMYQSVPDLPNPSGAPEAGTAFTETWSVGNGGYHVSGSNVGNLDKVTFRVYEVTGSYFSEYYAATADVWKADSTGHTYLTTNVLLVTAWPGQDFELYWDNGQISFYVLDGLGRQTMEAHYNLAFTAGPATTNAYSAELDFTINSTPSIGCHGDILSYDQNYPQDIGHFFVETYYGTDMNNLQTAYVAAPTTNSMCSLLTTHYPDVYDVVQWTNQGF